MSTIKDFEDHLREDGKSEKTIESYIGDLGGLEVFLQEHDMEVGGILNRFAINSFRTMLLYIEDNVSLRDKAIVQILFYTGVRVSELSSIRIKDIDFLTHQLKVYGKGGKFREVCSDRLKL